VEIVDIVMVGRVVIALVIAATLLFQARNLSGQPNRRRAFQFGAAALFCFAAFNLSIGAQLEFGALQQLTALAGIALFVGAAISLLLSLRSGERRADRDRALAEASAYRAEREQALAEKRGSRADDDQSA
jgi:hypothetical protein